MCSVTVGTFWPVFNFITVGIRLPVTMHLIRRVTLVAFKVFFFMDVRFHSLVFSEVLFFDAAAVAAGAGEVHGRDLLELVSGRQAAAQVGGPADVALATGRGVARFAMVIHHGFDLGHLGRRAAGGQHRTIAGEVGVKARRIRGDLFVVAILADA